VMEVYFAQLLLGVLQIPSAAFIGNVQEVQQKGRSW
jgi:hypothetical protein